MPCGSQPGHGKVQPLHLISQEESSMSLLFTAIASGNHAIRSITASRLFPGLICLSLICLASGCGQSESNTIDLASGKVAGTVQLEIDYQSDRKNTTVDVPCSADSTVFKILERAQNLGDVRFEATGQSDPATTFVNSIGGVDNLANKGDNWIFLVNGDLGDKSCALISVKPGDEVTWVFGKYEPKDND